MVLRRGPGGVESDAARQDDDRPTMTVDTIRTQATAFWQQAFLPAALAMLPAPFARRALCFVARRFAVFEDQCASTWRAAAACGARPAVDEAGFKSRHRLHLIADHFDVYAMATRGRRWLARNAVVTGTPPAPGAPFIALTFHYGAGMWAHPYFASLNRRTQWVHAPVPASSSRLSIATAVARLRLRVLQRAMAQPTIETGGSHAKIVDCLGNGGAVMALFDTPHRNAHRTAVTRVLGGDFHLISGIFRIAVATAAPVYLYTCTVCASTGRRLIDVEGPLAAESVQSLVDQAGAFMDRKVRADPAAWHFWNLLPLFRQ